MSTMVKLSGSRFPQAIYGIASIALSLGPVWAWLIVELNHGSDDTLGSGGNVYAWAGYVLIFLIALFFSNFTAIILSRFYSMRVKIILPVSIFTIALSL